MNFKFTPRTTAIFIASFFAAGTLNVIFDSRYLGLGVMLAVCYYLANEQKRP